MNNWGWRFLIFVLCIILLVLGAGVVVFATAIYGQFYDGRIYPGVHVYEVDLGGLTIEEAGIILWENLPDSANQPLILYSAENTWSSSWADLGVHFDPKATARLAYQVGREGDTDAQVAARLESLFFGRTLSAVIVVPDVEHAHSLLHALAEEVSIPPVDAALVIQPAGVRAVAPQAGRRLDVEGTAATLASAFYAGPEGLTLEVLTRLVEPALTHTEPAKSQAEALLASGFQLIARDPLTGYTNSWDVEPEALAGWLLARSEMGPDGVQLVLTVEQAAVQIYLEQLDQTLPAEVVIDVESARSAVQAAVEAGERQALMVLKHPSLLYTIQYGDTLTSVAREYGFPVWRLIESNPDIQLSELRPGQQIVIPSLDILFPWPLITERHILVDISDQHCSAYEGERLVYDFICSTGIDSSPTFPGTFQVLSKEENAYASNWDLWMPHFLGVYQAGPDFTNGFHALPFLSSGNRLWEGYLGSPISYGCIVLGVEEAEALYQWAELGTLVIIQD